MRQMAEANKGPRRKKVEAGHATKKQDPESTEPRTYWRPIATDPRCTLQKNAGKKTRTTKDTYWRPIETTPESTLQKSAGKNKTMVITSLEAKSNHPKSAINGRKRGQGQDVNRKTRRTRVPRTCKSEMPACKS